MKTPMQELIEKLEEKRDMWDKETKSHNDIKNTYQVAIIVAKNLVEKEKQRMFHCFNAGADDVSERRFNEWFNQTYNQNK